MAYRRELQGGGTASTWRSDDLPFPPFWIWFRDDDLPTDTEVIRNVVQTYFYNLYRECDKAN